MSSISVPLAASARHLARHAVASLHRVGQVSLEGVRSDSPSRRDTFFLLRVAARHRRSSRVGSCVGRQALSLTIRASFVACNGRAAMHNRVGCAQRKATTTSQTTARFRLERTVPSGGWIRRQSRKEIERRQPWQRPVKLTLRFFT